MDFYIACMEASTRNTWIALAVLEAAAGPRSAARHFVASDEPQNKTPDKPQGKKARNATSKNRQQIRAQRVHPPRLTLAEHPL